MGRGGKGNIGYLLSRRLIAKPLCGFKLGPMIIFYQTNRAIPRKREGRPCLLALRLCLVFFAAALPADCEFFADKIVNHLYQTYVGRLCL
jgi:hypothetical protein